MSRIPLRTPQTTLKYDLEDDEFYLSKASHISTLTLLRVAESKNFPSCSRKVDGSEFVPRW